MHDAAFGLFKAEIRTTLEVRHAAMTRDFDGVRAEWCVRRWPSALNVFQVRS